MLSLKAFAPMTQRVQFSAVQHSQGATTKDLEKLFKTAKAVLGDESEVTLPGKPPLTISKGGQGYRGAIEFEQPTIEPDGTQLRFSITEEGQFTGRHTYRGGQFLSGILAINTDQLAWLTDQKERLETYLKTATQ